MSVFCVYFQYVPTVLHGTAQQRGREKSLKVVTQLSPFIVRLNRPIEYPPPPRQNLPARKDSASTPKTFLPANQLTAPLFPPLHELLSDRLTD